jgi:hypothetical protein
MRLRFTQFCQSRSVALGSPLRNKRATDFPLRVDLGDWQAECPLLALSGHAPVHCTCPLSSVKQTSRFALQMSAYDPKRTSIAAMGSVRVPPAAFQCASLTGYDGLS